jgi:hypothetical protein
MNVSRNCIEVHGKLVNPSFVILPTYRVGLTQPSWCKYYTHIKWETDEPVPNSLLVLQLGHHGKFVYSRCAPFCLEADECSSWLTWEVLPIPDISFGIKMLHVIPGKDPNDPTNGTRISSLIQYSLYSQQIMARPKMFYRENDESSTMTGQASATPDQKDDDESLSNSSEDKASTSLTCNIGCKWCC